MLVASAAAILACTTPETVLLRIRPVIAAVCEAEKAQFDAESLNRIRRHLSPLLLDRGQVSDQAVAILLAFDLGDAYQYEILHNATARGRRVLPYLRRYAAEDIDLQDGGCIERMKIDPDTREADYRLAVERVSTGRIWGRDDAILLSSAKTSPELLRPILALICDALSDGSAWRTHEKLAWLVSELLARQDSVADEALVRLLPIYVGEHTGEQLFNEVVRRGQRMLPLLEGQARISAAERDLKCKPPIGAVPERVSTAIRAIRARSGEKEDVP